MPDYTSIHTGPVIDQGVSEGLTAVQPADLATVAISGDYTDLINIPATFVPSAHNHIATDITDFTEAVGDAVNGLLVAGTNVSFSYNDVANTFTINATGPSTIAGITGNKAQFDTAVTDGNFMYVGDAPTAHTHVAANITDFSEAVDDRVGSLLVAGANVTLTYDDVANTLTVASSGGGGGSFDYGAWAAMTGMTPY